MKQNIVLFIQISKVETFINESDIDDIFESIYITIISNIQKFLEKGLGWLIDSVIDNIVNILKYNPLAECSYIKLPKELDHPKKGLIEIQHFDDNECFKWCLVRYLHTASLFAYTHLASIRKIDILSGDELDFEDIKFPVKGKDVDKIERKNSINISVFGYENKEKYLIYVPNKCFKERHFALLLTEEEDKKTLCFY